MIPALGMPQDVAFPHADDAMRSLDLRIDVAPALGRLGPIEIAVTLHLPADEAACRALVIAFPGAGYGRGYFDIRWGDGHAFSQAAHHVAHGLAFAACDHPGVGDSDGDGGVPFTLDEIAAANALAARVIADGLAQGMLDPELSALGALPVVGIGQSMGGTLLILAQAAHRPFDAVALLGSSAIENVMPQATPALTEATRAFYNALARGEKASPPEGLDPRYPFHREDVDPALVEADLGGGYPLRQRVPAWGSARIPRAGIAVMGRGAVTEAAAAIDVPVFIALGDRDFAADPHAEPAAYRGSRDVTLFIAPDMAHMHNFAPGRRVLWDRLACWSRSIATAAGEPSPRPQA